MMDKQEFEWKAKELGDKAKDLFNDEDDACYILSTGLKYDEDGFAGCIEVHGSDKNIKVSVVNLLCTMAERIAKVEGVMTEAVLYALFMSALRNMKDDE